ncbi:hypothetical protein [Thermoclostridium stercorarium]|nr:hypothetical protein [Thermoclostridium stercorarium]
MGKPLDTPLIDALNNFISAGRIPMHMPGISRVRVLTRVLKIIFLSLI